MVLNGLLSQPAQKTTILTKSLVVASEKFGQPIKMDKSLEEPKSMLIIQLDLLGLLSKLNLKLE